MQVTIDIPEELYRELESQAKAAHTSVEDLFQTFVTAAGKQAKEGPEITTSPNGLPLIKSRSSEPVNLLTKHLTNLNDAMFWMDEDFAEMEREALRLELEEREREAAANQRRDAA